MYYVIIGLVLLTSVFLVFLVILQNSKGGGLANLQSANFASQYLGAARAPDLIQKVTWWSVGTLAVLVILANFIMSQDNKSNAGNSGLKMRNAVESAKTEAPAAAPLPNLPAPSPVPAPAPPETEKK